MKRYFVNNELYDERGFYDRLYAEVYADVKENFDEILDDLYPEYHMGDLIFLPSQILKTDKPAYNEELLAEVDSEMNDYLYQLSEDDELKVGKSDFRIYSDEG